jgi:S-formylglutathione hydrolase FrmB
MAVRRDEPVAAVPAGVVLRDVTFRSAALGREVTYRLIAPTRFKPGEPVRMVYLLHGNGQDYREWSLYSRAAEWARQGFVLVMPEGYSSYFMNAVVPASDRYEDFVTHDVVADAERGLGPVTRQQRAIAGVSMGGFAALVLGMKHPEEYGFVGALSPPVDAAERGFRLQRWQQYWGFRRIFGPMGSATRRADDPFAIMRGVDAARMPFVYLGVGGSEPLREPVERFDRALTRAGVRHEFEEQPGAHNWGQWRLQLPGLFAAMQAHLR